MKDISHYIKKGSNENVNNINIKTSVNLGDLIKKIKVPVKRKKKGGGSKSGAGGDQIVEPIQGPPGMPGQAGAPGIDATPNQPFFPAPSSSSSVIPSYMSNTTIPNQQDIPVSSSSVIPSYMSNTTIPQQQQRSIATTLENNLSAYERARKLAKDFGVPIPESERTISSASNAQPNNPAQLKAVDDELENETQSILNRLPNVPIERTGSSNSTSSNILDNLYPLPPPSNIFSSSTGQKSLENITSNNTGVKPTLFPPMPFNQSLPLEQLQFNIPPLKERLELQNKEKVLRLEQNKLEKAKNDALKENPRDIEKIKNIDNQLKDIRKQRAMLIPGLNPVVDNNSTQSGLQLARSESNTSVASSVLPPRLLNQLYAPPSINNFFSDVMALKNAPVKTQQQITRELLKEPFSFEKGSSTKYIPPKKSNTYDDSLSLSQNLDRTTPKFKILPTQPSLLDQIASQPKKTPPPERNLLGQTFSAFSNLLSNSRDARDAAGYGALALGAVQPELLPAIGLAETGNQALNIIEAPVNSIERAIQQRINNPPPPPKKRKDAYGGF